MIIGRKIERTKIYKMFNVDRLLRYIGDETSFHLDSISLITFVKV